MSLITNDYNWYSDIDNFYGFYTSHDIIYNESDKNKLKFLSCNYNSGCETVKQLTFTDKLKVAYISKYFQNKDMEITILIEGALKKISSGYTFDDVALATSIVAFEKGDFFPENFIVSLNDETIVKGTIKSYPNPFSDIVTITFDGLQDFGQICIYDLFGRKVFAQDVTFDQSAIGIHLSSLDQGTYIYKIYQINVVQGTGKLINPHCLGVGQKLP